MKLFKAIFLFKKTIHYLLFSRGFASVVIGSDLKWWKINPCDASKGRNIFQSLHKCDLETTVVSLDYGKKFSQNYFSFFYFCLV